MKNLLEVTASELRLEELERDWPVKVWPGKTASAEALGWECGQQGRPGCWSICNSGERIELRLETQVIKLKFVRSQDFILEAWEILKNQTCQVHECVSLGKRRQGATQCPFSKKVLSHQPFLYSFTTPNGQTL